MWILKALLVWVLISLVASGFIGHFLAGRYRRDPPGAAPAVLPAEDDS